jgi:hypothetical protein
MAAKRNSHGLLVTPKGEPPMDPLMVERVRIFYQRIAKELRELELYKRKRGVCVAGISCCRKALTGPRGGHKACPHHAAAAKAGIRLARWKVFESEYGRLRKAQREAEREKRKQPRKKAA